MTVKTKYSIKTKAYKLKWLIILQLIFFLMTSASRAAEYYVDHTAGKDSNQGTQSQPWQNCPGMLGWSGSATLKAGDTVYFDSADTWSSSRSAPILTVKGGVSYIGDTWGSGKRATFRATDTLKYASVLINKDDPVYRTLVEGFDIDMNNKGFIGNAAGVGINWPIASGSLTGATKTVKNCIIHDIKTENENWYGIKVGAYNGYNTNNVEIIDCGVYNTPATGMAIYASVATSASQINDVLVRGCTVHDAGQGKVGEIGNGITLKNNVDNCIVEYCHSYNQPARGFQIDNTNGTDAPTNVKIRNCITHDNGKGGIVILHDGDKSGEIYNNLIFNNNGNGGAPGVGLLFMSIMGGTNSFKVYNNTFYNNAEGGIYVQSSSAKFNTLEFKNNIICSAAGQYPFYNEMDGVITSHKNNLFYSPDGGNLVRDGNKYYDSGSVSSWEGSALAADPLFKNTSDLPSGFIRIDDNHMMPNTDGLNLSLDSPARDYGVVLGSNYNSSINSVTRLSSEKWDLGAYENGSSSSALPPPLNLRLIE